MKKFICLFIGCIALTGYAQNNLIELICNLNGANAVPPNNSPLVADASFSFGTRYIGGFPQFQGTPPTGVLTSNTFLVLVFFTPSNLVNDLGISPNEATIQDEAGNVITNLNPFTNNSHALTPYPGYPGGPGFPEVKYSGFFILTPSQVNDLLAGKWYVHISATNSLGEDYPNGQIRGQILVPDSDGDGITDWLDQCPNTPKGAVVNSDGCSIEQLCPCGGPWRNHGEYITCVADTAAQFLRDGLISETERRNIVSAAIRSSCGKRTD
jgi:hypothetical protein